MNTLVVYDSTFGNTEQVARAIGTALRAAGPTSVLSVAQIDRLPEGTDLLVAGCPTQAHGVDAPMKAFLDAIPEGALAGMAAAAFDTRYHVPKFLSGSAAQGIARRLEQKGARLVALPESFFVEHSKGPLADGELLRAASWAGQLAVVFAEAR